MARTQIDGDSVRDKSITADDLSDSANPYASKAPKIYQLTGFRSNFVSIDYTILNLYPKRHISKGEVYKVDWFKTKIGEELSDLILTVDISYTRDSSGFALSRVTRRRWVNNDDSYNSKEKITNKDYTINVSEMIHEGKARRELLVDSIQIPVMQGMLMVLLPLAHTQEDVLMMGRAFMDDYDLDFKKFINNSSTITNKNDVNYGRKTIVVKLENESNPNHVLWLDLAPSIFGGATIRQYLINEFSI